mgnify:CR=1 FL=1
MSLKVGISGFGRIGRDVLRIYMEEGIDDFEIVALNASGDLNTLAHLFKYDSLYGKFNGTIEVVEDGFIINGKKIKVVAHRNPEEIPWKDFGVDVVFECTGRLKGPEDYSKHIKAGAKKVFISAPADGVDLTMVYGINHEQYDPSKHQYISNASCTTNCLAPLAKALNEEFGIEHGTMTTIHSYTNDQSILDASHKDYVEHVLRLFL